MQPGSAYERSIIGLAGLAGLMFLAGIGISIFHRSSNTEVAVTIDAAPERVWRYIVEPDRRSSWQTGVLSVNPLTGEGIAQGDTNLLFMQAGGESWQIDERIMRADRPELWQAEQSSPRRSGTVTIRLEPVAGPTGPGTELHYTHVFEEHRFWRRFFAPWLAWQAKSVAKRMLARLAELVEADD